MIDARYASLKGRAVLVSGGASGIGEALVRGFAGQGCRVAFVDIAEAEGRALAVELSGLGQSVIFAPCDITDIPAYQATIARLGQETGPFRVLCNNAAHDQRHKLEDVTPAFFDERVAVNLKHQMFAIQSVVPGMVAAGGGSVINFGSMSWMAAMGGFPVYATCKAAIHGMTRTLARDYGKQHIRFNTLVPGWVMTQRQLDLWVTPEGEAQMDKALCLAGRVMPEDIAAMALFLGSDDAKMISAQEFVVDGGWV